MTGRCRPKKTHARGRRFTATPPVGRHLVAMGGARARRPEAISMARDLAGGKQYVSSSFSEEKEAKRLCESRRAGVNRRARERAKVFCFFFSKKKSLPKSVPCFA
jgi:hypothetical protein